ncbi:hypothetical protein A7982_13683 [Minicystis rosea]|nr:hypothetical protein A7982_13683 [Minicystis rosea]
MPGFLLTIDAKVTCSHAGLGTPLSPSPHVFIGGKPAVNAVTPYVISGCANTVPCTLALGWMRPATQVTSAGLPLLLADSMATCVPTAVPTTVAPAQAFVKGT